MTADLSPPEAARAAIETSGLSKTTIANALALLSRAHPHNGHITLTWGSLLDLFGLTHRRSATRHLTYLSQAGIIHYSTNAQVFVTFYAWTPLRVGAQNMRVGAQNMRVGAQDMRVGAQDMRVGAQPSDPGPARGRADVRVGAQDMRVGAQDMRVGAQSDSAIKGMSECVSILTLTPDEKNHSLTLLTDPAIGVNSWAVLDEIVALRPFEEIRAICCDLFAEGREDGSYAGLVVSRIRTAASVPPLRHNDLYQRHRTPAEIAAEEAEREEAERIRQEHIAERERQLAERPAPDAIWEKVLAELALSLPRPAVEQWLSGASGSVEDGVLTIVAANAYARDWLHNRLLPQIRRSAARIAGRSLEVQITA